MWNRIAIAAAAAALGSVALATPAQASVVPSLWQPHCTNRLAALCTTEVRVVEISASKASICDAYTQERTRRPLNNTDGTVTMTPWGRWRTVRISAC